MTDPFSGIKLRNTIESRVKETQRFRALAAPKSSIGYIRPVAVCMPVAFGWYLVPLEASMIKNSLLAGPGVPRHEYILVPKGAKVFAVFRPDYQPAIRLLLIERTQARTRGYRDVNLR